MQEIQAKEGLIEEEDADVRVRQGLGREVDLDLARLLRRAADMAMRCFRLTGIGGEEANDKAKGNKGAAVRRKVAPLQNRIGRYLSFAVRRIRFSASATIRKTIFDRFLRGSETTSVIRSTKRCKSIPGREAR